MCVIYTLDGSTPSITSVKEKKPFLRKGDRTLRKVNVKGKTKSKVIASPEDTKCSEKNAALPLR